MPEPVAIAQFERRLVQMGCPARRIAENIRELREHYDDLKQAALDEGLSEKEAEKLAGESLGHPVQLAENAVLLWRQSSWWGRHPFVGFCLLPLPVFLLGWVLFFAGFGGVCWLLGRIFGPAYIIDKPTLDSLLDNSDTSSSWITSMNTTASLTAVSVVLGVFYWMARRSSVGIKWLVAACLSCALISLLNWSELRPHSITCGFGWPPEHWSYAAIPMLVAAAFLISQWYRQRRLAGIPPAPPVSIGTAGVSKKRLITTPTFWIVTVVLLALFRLIAQPLATAYTMTIQKKELDRKVWPVERSATLALLKTRQSVTPPTNERTINLQPVLNATLADSVYQSDCSYNNDLKALPLGIHTYGGISFDVEGRVQLAGDALTTAGRKFPSLINIPISGKCSRIHLLQGAADLDNPGNKIAWLIFHYKDGSNATVDIIGGRDVLDWWGPVYNTEASDRYTTSPDTELAWAGSNPGIKKEAPEFSLRLYRSTFANPHPELEVSSIDYVSALSGAAPFLVGLTIEQP